MVRNHEAKYVFRAYFASILFWTKFRVPEKPSARYTLFCS